MSDVGNVTTLADPSVVDMLFEVTPKNNFSFDLI